jgi:hypothetical protein
MAKAKAVDFIHKFLQFQEQIRILHWQTYEYARHMAYGKTYDDIGGHIDKFVELYIGKYGRSNMKGAIEIENAWEIDAKKFLNDFITFLISLTGELDGANDTDLLNTRDEILGVANQLKYLLSLK